MRESEKTTRFRGVLFDLDGTLLNTLEDLAEAVNTALSEMGLPPRPFAFFSTAVGDGAKAMVERCLPSDCRDTETVSQTLALFIQAYSNCWNVKTKLYDGVQEMLKGLQSAGLVCSILSNKPDHATRQIVREFMPDHAFTVVRGALHDSKLKPDPEAAFEIAKACAIPISAWAYVGDTDTDMQTATNARMFAIGAAWGFRSTRELKEHGADAIAAQPADILQILL